MPRSHASTSLRIAVPLLLASALAYADDPVEQTVIATAPQPPDPNTQTISNKEIAPKPEEPPAARYPRSVIARPLTLPKGIAMLGADATANHDFSAMGGAPIVGYGFTDKLEVQVPYVFATRELEARGNLGVDVGYVLLRGALGGKLEAIARARAGYSVLDSTATPLMIGVHVQYNITPTLAVISGVPGSQQLCITLADDADMAKPLYASLPLGVGYQATNELYLQLDTKLLQVGFHDAPHALLAKDTSPLALTAIYNVINALDIQAALATDFNTGVSDALTFLVGARYYAGQL